MTSHAAWPQADHPQLEAGHRGAGPSLGKARALTLGTAVIAATTLAVTGVSPAAFAAPRPVQSIAWAPCPQDATADCGTLAVPIDWARPSGPTVDLALVRRRATDPSARVGSLLINPGGPGGSGVEAVLYGAETFTAQLRKHFDVVGFDPRGVAGSHPIMCANQLPVTPPATIASQADFEAQLRYNRALAEDCKQRTGPLFDHVDSLSVVRDVDAIRAAVGDQKLTYYGVSYGTMIGQQYAETFGHRARAIVVDSNMDHSLGTEAFLVTETQAVQDIFTEFAAWCGRTTSCGLHGQNMSEVFASLKARAARGELTIEVPESGQRAVLTPDDLPAIVFQTGYGPEWVLLADILTSLDKSGTYVPTTGPQAGTRATAMIRSALTVSPLNRARLAGEDVKVHEYSVPIFCEDWNLPVRDYAEYQALLRKGAAVAPDMGSSPLAVGMLSACLGWPGPVNNPQHRLRPTNTRPILLTNSRFDPATPYVWGASAARQAGRKGVLMTYEGWGHGTYGRSECTTAPVDAYLIGGTLPSVTRCPAVEPTAASDIPERVSAAASGPAAASEVTAQPRRGLGW